VHSKSPGGDRFPELWQTHQFQTGIFIFELLDVLDLLLLVLVTQQSGILITQFLRL